MWTKMFRHVLLVAALAGGLTSGTIAQFDNGDDGDGGDGGNEETPGDPPGGEGPIGPPGDATGDCFVDVNDLLLVLGTWGDCAGCPADFDGNGVVDVTDLLTVLANWGTGGGSSSGEPPQPLIQHSGLVGPAPFTVHVDALATELMAGDPLTAHYEWDFGDESGTYNELVGWVAAHEYRSPGEYVITLTVTDETGAMATATKNVVVGANTRSKIHVSPSGNDSFSGTTESSAVRTMTRAFQLIDDGSEVLVERGATYSVPSGLSISEEDVRIGTYGSGSKPELEWSGPLASVSGIIELQQSADNVVIEDIVFSSPGTPDRDSARGVLPNGTRVTIRNCEFYGLSDAVNAERRPEYMLMQDNVAGLLGAYLLWGSGWDFTILGNSVENSVSEHNVRFSGLDRSLVAYNSLHNDLKSCLWSMTGSYSYITQNEMSEGPVSVGANEFGGNASDQFNWSVIERNYLFNDNIRTTSGADHVMIRNNVVRRDGDSAITISGYNSDFNRTSVDVRIINNTGINDSSTGRFAEIRSPGDDLVIANNLYVAWNLETGQGKTANVYIEEENLDQFTIRTNLWANPETVGWGEGWHYVWPFWSDVEGYKDPDEWLAFNEVTDDEHETFSDTSLDADFVPQFTGVNIAQFQPGIHVDFYGNPRAVCTITAVGAVVP